MASRPTEAWKNTTAPSPEDMVDASTLLAGALQTPEDKAADLAQQPIEYVIIKAGSKLHADQVARAMTADESINLIDLHVDPAHPGQWKMRHSTGFNPQDPVVLLVVDEAGIQQLARNTAQRTHSDIKKNPEARDGFYRPLLTDIRETPDLPERERQQRLVDFGAAAINEEMSLGPLSQLYPNNKMTQLHTEINPGFVKEIAEVVQRRLESVVNPPAASVKAHKNTPQ